ncbi:PilW family protein [Myxococcus sp. AS-1-15]|jgi:type IV pilus assembly protein PilW|uniref:PilW family protein n=1 Tax=Myxococcus TaxID=32 RepID=UPI001CBF5D6E|nr:prepilin-type N-terminal cleavage/methylation domain-containing protein [Myxococcus sp. AS-1-15]MBZ4397772.1 prepilin-type N-terminal cleavage/methylation domain-containing protein [Myxococcus sp. AS-1-15]BDT31501.1 prepilin-type N-terminal cleavage/methylation domain-containing protein [Myxococcus sp. MH1]
MSRAPHTRGFSLIELMMASTIALVVIAGAVSAGTYLQRRGFLEERTMETQNAARAARDLFTPSLQRAGEGFGSSPLYLGGAPGELRYAINVTSAAGASAGYVPPSGAYATLRSDVLEIFEADSARSLRMRGCAGGNTDARLTATTQVCLVVAAPPGTDAGIPTGSALVAADPSARGACVGVAQAQRNLLVLPDTEAKNIAWLPGAPGATAFDVNSYCTATAGNSAPLWLVGNDDDAMLMPVTSRIYRVNWRQGRPALELDPDGSLGPEEFRVLSEEIEQLRVRLGVATLENPSDPLRYFPDPDTERPPIDQCTNTRCWGLIPGDAGTMGALDHGPGSARDELMRRVRVVELLITARSARPDREAARGSPDAGTLPDDDEGNPDDGYKRRHFLIRVTPRNFGYAGG